MMTIEKVAKEMISNYGNVTFSHEDEMNFYFRTDNKNLLKVRKFDSAVHYDSSNGKGVWEYDIDLFQ